MNAVAINELSKLNATPDKVLKKALIYFGVGLGVLLVIFIVYKIYKSMQQAPEKRELEKELEKDNLTQPESKYAEWAATIYLALDGYTEDEDAVYRILNKLQNKDEWIKLKLEFGTKKDMTLNEWLNKYFSDSEIAEVNKILGKFNESI